jgi:XisH protein
MPAIDSCEPSVIRALEKEGWQIVNRPCTIALKDGRRLFADLKAKRQIDDEQQIIIIEVKCFPESSSQIEEFYRAFGQYMTYAKILARYDDDEILYLAVPSSVYDTLFQKDPFKDMLEDSNVNLIVCDMESEEIVKWIR